MEDKLRYRVRLTIELDDVALRNKVKSKAAAHGLGIREAVILLLKKWVAGKIKI